MSATAAPGGFRETVRLTHRRVDLALHRLDPDGDDSRRPLLLLHGLAECTPTTVPVWADGWRGPVWGLDFTGHGHSTVPMGGGYTAEALLGDADAALAHLGPLTVVGRGLGAYVALLLAGGRPEQVLGAVLADGPGLAGGGPRPTSQALSLRAAPDEVPDPLAVQDLANDVRPPDYAVMFARMACLLSPAAVPIVVAARAQPEWLVAVAADPDVRTLPLSDALAAVSS